MKVVFGNLDSFPSGVQDFIKSSYELCKPDDIHLCNGSDEEKKLLIDKLVQNGSIKKLSKYDNCYLARTSPEDVARVESRTFMCTKEQRTSMCIPKPGVEGKLGNWANDDEMRAKLNKLFDGSMKGRTMYVLPFCMGPLGSELSKIGVEITDSPYVVVSMGVMTTMGDAALKYLKSDTFIKCLHSVGCPLPLPESADPSRKTWPCNPENTYITQFPDSNEIISFGSGYGGNSLLGKKCFALRMASNLGKKEGWLAEHMLILGLKNPQGEKKYICGAFPSACGKTNLAMMTPTLPGWELTCVGDDIAWMRFDSEGNLRAINPEKGFFGVAPGTSNKSNPAAMKAIYKDTIFTNVCETSDGGVFWEGLEDETDMKNLTFIDWLGKPWTPDCGRKAAHPNSRFCAPIRNCPILDEAWDDPQGVPISAMIFGARRPTGIPLVYQSLSWEHGVLTGASMRSETTAAAADVTSKSVVHDPFAMRPFFGYNFGKYAQHWLDIGNRSGAKLPKIFHVNWFLKDSNGKFVWPGFGENSRVLKWIFERCDDVENFHLSPIGYLPEQKNFDLSGLPDISFDVLFKICPQFWKDEVASLKKFFEDMVGGDFPQVLKNELDQQSQRLGN